MHRNWKFWLVIAIGVTVCALLVTKPPAKEAGIVVFMALMGQWVVYIFADFGWWLFKALRWLVGLIVHPVA